MPVLLALAAAVTFALSAPLAKLLLGDLPPLMLAGFLYLGAGLFLSLLSIFRKDPASRGRGFARSERWVLTAAVIAGGILAPPLLLWVLPGARPARRRSCSIWKCSSRPSWPEFSGASISGGRSSARPC